MDRRGFLLTGAALTLGAGARTARRPVVLATADLEARLVAVDLGTGAVLGHVPTRAYPRSIETVGNTAVVAHSELGLVSLVDGRTRSVRHVLDGFGEPRYTAAHPDGRHAYVTDAERGELVTLDVATGRALGRLPVGRGARHLGIDPTGTAIWTALGSKAETIATVDLLEDGRTGALGHIRPPVLAHDVVFAPDGRHVWVSSGDSRTLLVYTPAGRLVARLGADAPPQHISFDRTTAYVTSGLSGTIRRFTLGGRPLSRTRIPVGSYNVQYGGRRVVTAALGRGSLTILDRDGTVLHSQRIARSSHDAAVVTG